MTVTDIYGDQFTHNFKPVPDVDNFGRPAEVNIGHIHLYFELYFII